MLSVWAGSGRRCSTSLIGLDSIAARAYGLHSHMRGAAGGVFRIEGDDRSEPGAYCADAPALCLYREPLGGGALMKRKPPAVRSIGIDRDERALEAFGCDYPVELVHGCAHSFLASFPFLGPELV